jgi:hypothetical protein
LQESEMRPIGKQIEKRLENLWGSKKITKKAHTGRWHEIKWEMSNKETEHGGYTVDRRVYNSLEGQIHNLRSAEKCRLFCECRHGGPVIIGTRGKDAAWARVGAPGRDGIAKERGVDRPTGGQDAVATTGQGIPSHNGYAFPDIELHVAVRILLRERRRHPPEHGA